MVLNKSYNIPEQNYIYIEVRDEVYKTRQET